MTIEVELRCPLDRQRMFGKLLMEQRPQITEGNLLAFSCDKCRRRGERVVHRFNLAGEFVDTIARK